MTGSKSRNDALRIMVRQVKERGPANGDFIHVCQLAERFLDRLDADAVVPSETRRIWMVSSKTMSVPFATEEAAQRYVSNFPASVGGGMHISEMTVHE